MSSMERGPKEAGMFPDLLTAVIKAYNRAQFGRGAQKLL